MLVKNKKNCKLEKQKYFYYVQTPEFKEKYSTYEEAFKVYKNINYYRNKKLETSYLRGKMDFQFYAEDVYLIIKSLEIFKFFVDKSMFFECEREDLKDKSVELFMLYEQIASQFFTYVPAREKLKIEKIYE